MSENNHTPEPWHLCEVENETGRIKHLVPVDAEKMSLLTIVENDQATFAAIYNDDDARRIIACVNACEGIPTDALERSKSLDEFMRSMKVIEQQRDSFKDAAEYNKRRAEDAEKQRDELMTELKKLTEVLANIGITSGLYDNEQDALKSACAAIAGVKGEQ